MRKTASALILITAFMLAGCSAKNGSDNAHNQAVITTGVGDVLSAATSSSETVTDAISSGIQPAVTFLEDESTASDTDPLSSSNGNEIDIDLTNMSANMVYSQVFCMVMEPEEYLGQTVKMEGTFVFYHDEAKDKNYYACIIRDAAQCCAQGIEFSPTGEYVYPGDFPEDGGMICVTGVFDFYEEDGNKYLTLRDADILPADPE